MQTSEVEHSSKLVESEPSKHGPTKSQIKETETGQIEETETGQSKEADQNEQHEEPETGQSEESDQNEQHEEPELSEVVVDEVVEEESVDEKEPEPEQDGEMIVPDQIVETNGEIVLQVQVKNTSHCPSSSLKKILAITPKFAVSYPRAGSEQRVYQVFRSQTLVWFLRCVHTHFFV